MNVKPGDLAVVIDGPTMKASPAARGRIVEVVSRSPDYVEEWHGAPCWLCQCATPIPTMSNKGTYRGMLNEGHVADQCLRPISDPPAEESTETREELTA